MRKHLRLFFQSAVILVILQTTGQAQPAFVSEVVNNSKTFEALGNIVCFNSGNLWRPGGMPAATILPKSGFTRTPNSLSEFHDILIFITTVSELWQSDGTFGGFQSIMFPQLPVTSKRLLVTYASLLAFGNSRLAGGQGLLRRARKK